MTVEYVYTGSDPFTGFLLVFLLILGAIFIGAIIANSSLTRTRRYRRELADLYIAAKIKQIASKDKIDIPEEYECFKKWVKRGRIEDQALDTTIKEELQEKITEGRKDMEELK